MQTFDPANESFSFWKNLVLISAFFIITPITLSVSLFSLMSMKKTQGQTALLSQSYLKNPNSGVKVFASLPSNFPSVSSQIDVKDARAEIVRNYLSSYNSVLAPYSDTIVQTADKYSLDFRLITAIAQKESNLCKIIPEGSHNCWGWGITGESTLGFTSYEKGIEEVSKGLRQEYLDKGYQTPEEIMSKYTPSSNGSWAQGVTQFMKEME